MQRRFYLVSADVLPEVFLKVIRVKELLASGQEQSVTAAARRVELSRSAYYKYALQSLLAAISDAGASIVTINQATPENGTAQVSVTIRTSTMQQTLDELTAGLSRLAAVVAVRLG